MPTRGRRWARPGRRTPATSRAAAAGARGLANPAPAGVVLVDHLPGPAHRRHLVDDPPHNLVHHQPWTATSESVFPRRFRVEEAVDVEAEDLADEDACGGACYVAGDADDDAEAETMPAGVSYRPTQAAQAAL